MAGLEVVSLEEKAGDFVLEIEITSNRPDWLSVVGIARDIAAITNKKFQAYSAEHIAYSKKLSAKCYPLNAKTLKVEIEDKKDCPLYTARIIKGVRVGPSPEWLRKRLELIGCRSVNNLVDITNYILFELGEPLHAFDLDKITSGEIFVRRAKPKEKIVTIDNIERPLSENILVIADSQKPLAIAGVMGGINTEVGFATKNILLEAAIFNPILIRRGRQELGLQSESSYRFERGVDLKTAEKASQRATELIIEVCGGSEVVFKSYGSVKPKAKEIILDLPDMARILGISISSVKVKQILSKLGFTVRERSKSALVIGVPSFRNDVNLAEDLIEEISRIFGYDRIPASLPRVLPRVTIGGRRDLVSKVRNILIGQGLSEAITYSLTDARILNDFAPSFGAIGIINPLSQEQEVLRTTLLPGLIRAVAHNLNQKLEYAALFEIGNVFHKTNNNPNEELMLGIALSGTKKMLLNEAPVRDGLGLLNLKGIIETLFIRLGINNYEFINQEGGVKVGVYINKEQVGSIATLSSVLLDRFSIKNREVSTLEVSLERVISFVNLDKRYVSLPKYPSITRDISFVLKKENSVKELLSLLQEKGGPLLRGLEITDYYKGKQIPTGYRGLTLSCIYGSSERTLTEEEITPIHSLIRSVLVDIFNAKIR
jgi:phenylalanyl-tRNA synthetase beta chain